MLVSANSNQPWNSPLPTLVLLPKCKTLSDVSQIHARIVTTGFISNSYVTTKIILKFSSSPHHPLFQFARQLFFLQHSYKKPQTQRNPFLWNAVIKTFSHGNDPKQAFVLLCLMLENGVCIDRFSVSLVLKACSRLSLITGGMQVHCLMNKMGMSDVFLENCLICMYLRSGCLECARQVFDRMTNRDSVSYNLVIDGYVKSGMVESAQELFDVMPEEEQNVITCNTMINGYTQLVDGLRIAWDLFEKMPSRDLVTYNSMIDCCIKCGQLETAYDLFRRMPKRDLVSWASMINGFAKLGNVSIARSLFNEMPRRDVVSLNAMMAGYVHDGQFTEALNLLYDMNGSNLSPDNATLLVALSAITQLGRVEEGIAIHRYIEENQISVNGKIGVSLIDMYSKCGNIKRAIEVFEKVAKKNVEHYNAMIGGLAIHGICEFALELFLEMEKLSLKPDDITFVGVLNACSHAGLVKEGLTCFELMKRVYNLQPKIQHYGCIVDILSRAGHLEEAKKFIEAMPVEPNDVIWRTLLSACKNHGNFKIGEPIAKNLMELDSFTSSHYVLLSNIYAKAGMWKKSYGIRKMMMERDLKKVPGCSWLKLEDVVHEFFVGDRSHSQGGEIYSMMDSLQALNSEPIYSGSIV